MRELMLILHFVGLAMGLGTAFTHAFMGIYTRSASKEVVVDTHPSAPALSLMGNVGMVLLLISGIYLILPYSTAIFSMPLLLLKLILVLVLIGLIAMIGYHGRKAATLNTSKHAKIAEVLGKVSLVVTLVILVVAVLIFR